MLEVDRAEFTLSRHGAYYDSPQFIGYGATISAPHMHAFALESLQSYAQNGKVLDVGSGSGYLTVCFAKLGAKQVHGVEHIEQLVDWSISNILKSHSDLIRDKVV